MESRISTHGMFAIVGLALLLASSADARTFRMTGTWDQRIGPMLHIPLFGVENAPGVLVSATGSAPANLAVPINAFVRGSGTFRVPLPTMGLVQISTMFTNFGPQPNVDPTPMTVPGAFGPGAKTSRPANFGFCPGATANPACTTPTNGGTQGTRHGLVVYTAGPNQYGGTMRMLQGGFGAFSQVTATAPTHIAHLLIGNPGGLALGGSYARKQTSPLSAGPITTGGFCVGGCNVSNNALITVPGTQVDTIPGSTIVQTGFPWTTGMVTVKVNDVTTGTPMSTFTITGNDARTALGAGTITLVSGGLVYRVQEDDVTDMRSTVTMTFAPQNRLRLQGLGSPLCAR